MAQNRDGLASFVFSIVVLGFVVVLLLQNRYGLASRSGPGQSRNSFFPL